MKITISNFNYQITVQTVLSFNWILHIVRQVRHIMFYILSNWDIVLWWWGISAKWKAEVKAEEQRAKNKQLIVTIFRPIIEYPAQILTILFLLTGSIELEVKTALKKVMRLEGAIFYQYESWIRIETVHTLLIISPSLDPMTNWYLIIFLKICVSLSGYRTMAKVHVCNVVVQNNPAKFLSKFELEITFEVS